MFSRLEFTGNRLLMKVMKVAFALIPIRDPKLYTGAGSLLTMGEAIADSGVESLLVVTSAGLIKRGQLDDLIALFERRGVKVVVFSEVEPDPTFATVNKGLERFKAESCDAVLVVGGGSAIDAAKVIALAAGNRCKPEKLKGFFRARRKAVPFFAAPTTAGTGSEATVAAVISEDVSHKKAFVIDHKTLPSEAALDPNLMLTLPAMLTATTGMDALTHAIESYIGTIGNDATDETALEAVDLIFKYLPRACENGNDIEARDAMALASYKAGQAFTRASVGYVHAMSHQLGAKYGVAHGLGNAVLLPHVIEFSSVKVAAKLARMAVLVGLGDDSESETDLAQRFVRELFEFNNRLNIPAVIEELKSEDIRALSRAARTEAHANYPVPRHMSRGDCELILRKCLPR